MNPPPVVLAKIHLDQENTPGHSTRPVAPVIVGKVTIDELEPKFLERSEPWIRLCNSLQIGQAQKVRAYPQDATAIIRRLLRKELVHGDFKIVERASNTGHWKLRAARGRIYKGDTYVVRLPDNHAEKERALQILRHGQHRLDGNDYRGVNNSAKLKENLYERWTQEFKVIPINKEQLFKINRSTLQTRIRRLVANGKLRQGEFRVKRSSTEDSAYVVRGIRHGAME